MSGAPVSVVAGLGPALGSSLARALLAKRHTVVGLSRSGTSAAAIASAGTDFRSIACDVTDGGAVGAAFLRIAAEHGPVRNLIYNAHELFMGSLLETSAETFERIWRVNTLGAFHCAQAVVPQMLSSGGGAIVVSGATASVRGGARFAAFAASKFALRGLAQSLAREYGPQGIHVVHVIIDGLIWGPAARDTHKAEETRCLEPDSIAETVMHAIAQRRSAWTREIDLRPAMEKS
jgi:NAD(P)-dependent dehydrogenase (short-subunit alcohol dehydrogenase family)